MERSGCYNSILDCIGNTPMVRLNRITSGLDAEVYAKLEFLNPMGSIKDRIARYMIEQAEQDGRLRGGELIIENSSGNTALGLAMVAIQKGYRLKVVVRDRTSAEKIAQIRALGADIHFVDSTLPPDHPDSYNQITPRLARQNPGCFFPDQHNNRENNDAHYHTTGPEIWRQMEGRIDILVAGMGTGGTLAGTARFLKEQDPGIHVIGVDVEGSVFTEYFRTGRPGDPRPYLTEGLGDEFIIGTADFSQVDEMIQVSDRDAFLTTRDLMRREGIPAGGSSGAVMWAVLAKARALRQPARIVTIFPDGASRYVSTIFDDGWMASHGFLPAPGNNPGNG